MHVNPHEEIETRVTSMSAVISRKTTRSFLTSILVQSSN